MKANCLQVLLVKVQDTLSCYKPDPGMQCRVDPCCPLLDPSMLKAMRLQEAE